MGGFEGGEIGEWIWRWRDRWVGLKETTPTLTRSVCRSEIMLAFWHLFVRENERGREKTKGFLDWRCRRWRQSDEVDAWTCGVIWLARVGWVIFFTFPSSSLSLSLFRCVSPENELKVKLMCKIFYRSRGVILRSNEKIFNLTIFYMCNQTCIGCKIFSQIHLHLKHTQPKFQLIEITTYLFLSIF